MNEIKKWMAAVSRAVLVTGVIFGVSGLMVYLVSLCGEAKPFVIAALVCVAWWTIVFRFAPTKQ